ncbi:MAG: sigma 54-interacting transcriptional regulator [Planctomycetota bacterium]|nr:MAG: sigma 54-interacting transcriptional regulator [Planctomycetota bacterium]
MSKLQAIIEIQREGKFVEQRRLGDEPLTIGRSAESSLVLADPTVSRQHAKIELKEGKHLLTDITGRQRTQINGQPVEQHELTNGDRIAIGPFILEYQTDVTVADTTQEIAPTETLLTLSPVESRLYDEICVRADTGRLSADERRLWAIKEELNQRQSDDQAVSLLLAEVMELIPADRGQVIYPSEREVGVVAASQPDDAYRDIPLSATVIRQVLATGQALVCLDVGQDRRFSAIESIAHVGARSILAAPLVIAGRVAGLICLMRESENKHFVEDDLNRLCALTRLAVDAVGSVITRKEPTPSTKKLQRQTDLPYPLIYRSKAMQQVVRRILRVAATDATVLITGASGSGKELIAAAIHYGSLISAGPFVRVNCAAIPENLIESELFGHEKGAFTDAKTTRKGRFELADGGTLFLDEIGDMPMAVQTRLLRAIESRQIERVGGSAPIPVRVRLIAATHQNLPDMVGQGRFREDLWYRLEVVRIDLPPLKDRSEDVPLLFNIFAESFAADMNASPVLLSNEAVRELSAHDWPGNVRQLRNLAERLTIFDAGQEVSAETIRSMIGEQDVEAEAPLDRARDAGPIEVAKPDRTLRQLAEARADFEREYIRMALSQTGGNITKAAEILGLARENLSRKIKQLKIDIP